MIPPNDFAADLGAPDAPIHARGTARLPRVREGHALGWANPGKSFADMKH